MKKTNDFFKEINDIICVYLNKTKHLSAEARSYITCSAVYSYILSLTADDKSYKSLRNYNIGYSVGYWMNYKKDVTEICESVVFGIFCMIDGVSVENNFDTININVELPEDQEYHATWCKHLKENVDNEK